MITYAYGIRLTDDTEYLGAAVFGQVGGGVAPTEDDTHHQRLEEFHHIEGFSLHHHLVGHTASYDYREQRSQSHTHLQYPPIIPSVSNHRK